MTDHDKVTEMLRNYRSYKYAVSNGISPFVEDDTLGMPMAFDYGPRIPRLTRGNTLASETDYKAYCRAVRAIDGAVSDVLDDEEQTVIRKKYMDRNTLTLYQIADNVHTTERRVLYVHKKALKKLAMALIFVEIPEIVNLDKAIKVPV